MPRGTKRFSQHLRRVLSLAQEGAERFQDLYIGPEHLLLGLVQDEGSGAERLLREMGLQVDKIHKVLGQRSVNAKRNSNARLDLAEGTKKTLDLAEEEAERAGHDEIATTDLLLGLLRQNDGTVIDILRGQNISPDELEKKVRQSLQ